MLIPTNREPTHPGIMLREEFLDPMGISQQQLADAINVPYQRINEIVNKRRHPQHGIAARPLPRNVRAILAQLSDGLGFI